MTRSTRREGPLQKAKHGKKWRQQLTGQNDQSRKQTDGCKMMHCAISMSFLTVWTNDKEANEQSGYVRGNYAQGQKIQ